MKQILVIEDNGLDLEPLGGILRQHGYTLLEDITGRNPAEEELRSSNDMLRAIIESAPAAIIGLDLDGNVRDVWNPAAEQMLGWNAEEVMGRPLPSVPAESEEEFRQFCEWMRSGRTLNGVEVKRRRRDGSPIEYSIYASSLHDGEGRVTGNIAVLVEVTERKRAEAALRASENRFRMFVETAAEGIWQVDREWRTTYVNRRMEEMLGCEPGSMLGLSICDFMDEEGRRSVAEHTCRRKQGLRETHDFRFVRRDGTTLDALVSATPMFDERGEFVGSFAMVTDISDRKRMQYELLLSQFCLDKACVGVFRGGPDARIHFVNESGARMLGYSREELQSLTFFDIDPTLTPEWWREHRAELTTTCFRTFETVHRRKDGTTFPVEVTVNYLEYDGVEFSCSFSRDITERKVAEEAVRQASLVVENSPAVCFRWRAAEGWPVEMVTRNVSRFGYTPAELLSGEVPFSSLVHPDDLERIAAEVKANTLRGEDRFQQEYRLVTRDGAVRWVDDRTVVERDASGRVTHYQGIVLDITDRKRTENVISARLRLLEFAAKHTLDDLLAATLDEAETLTDSQIGFYHFLEADQATLSLQNWSSRTKKECCRMEGKGLHYDVSAAGVWVDCIRQRRAVIHNDYASLPHRRGLPQGHAPVKRELVVPVMRGENIVAVLGVGNKPWDYNAQDVGTVSLLADLAWEIVERKRAEEALRISEQNYRDIVEHAPFGIVRSTREGKLLKANPATARILKYDSPEELIETVNRSSIQYELFVEPEQRTVLMDRIFTGDSWCSYENRYRCRDGSLIVCEVNSRRCANHGDEAVFESYLNDITGRRETENALRESEEKFRVLAETSPTAIFLYQEEMIVYANPATERLFGYGADELLRMRFWDWAHEDLKDMVRDRGLARLKGEPVPARYECRFVTRSGEERWLVVSAGLIDYRGGPAGVASFLDITEAKRAEERISAALAEKEILLREVHHRVKNNLQVISALLDLQSDYVRDEQSLGFFRESRDRIKTMALVHERLYNSTDMASIDFSEYVRNLAAHLSLSYVDDPDRISLKVDVADLSLGIEEAIPCGLIINELVTNSLKHAFPGGRQGEISIDCSNEGNGRITLGIRDNGVGFPDGLDFRNTETLGLQIVNLLTKQLRGTIEQRSEHGTSFTLRFGGEGGD